MKRFAPAGFMRSVNQRIQEGSFLPAVTLDATLKALESDVLRGAKSLLGTELVRGIRRARIIEVEAYRADDPGCHAFRGQTARNEIMFGTAGFVYVYFNYGVHWMLNVTAHSHGDPAAVLIRAAEPLEALEEMFYRRPKAKRP